MKDSTQQIRIMKETKFINNKIPQMPAVQKTQKNNTN